MKKLTRIFLLSILSSYVTAQSNTFYSVVNNEITNNFKFPKINSDSIYDICIGPRLLVSSSNTADNDFYHNYLIGLSIKANISKKFSFIGFYDYLDGNFNSEIKNYQDSLVIYYPGFGLNKNRLQFNAKYLANKFSTLELGHGKQFIGKGYRSLLLSDEASSYPYIKFTTKFGPVSYYNLYTTFLNSNMANYGRKKHAATHYLEFAINDNIKVAVFESVLWQSKTEQENTGYELAYLNPIIFYRPVEFSKQSNKGNALMGVNFNIKYNNIAFYGQFILDDLNISQQKVPDMPANSGGFFQDKYGYQIGCKFKKNDIKYHIEYNQVQPYTYGHRTILQNYSHMNQALAHPLGANFKELINIFTINKSNWTYKIKTLVARVGLDSAGTHYGQNIFASDFDASTGGQHSFGNFNGQGLNTTILSFQPEISFNLKGFEFFGLVYYRSKKSDHLNQNLIFYSLGIRNFPFSYFQDY